MIQPLAQSIPLKTARPRPEAATAALDRFSPSSTGWAPAMPRFASFSQLPPFNQRQNAGWSSVMTDIAQHEAPDDNNPYDDLITKGHETTHGINSWLRNNVDPPGPANWRPKAGFYLLENRSAVLYEPNFKKHEIIPYVPTSLRESRYDHYVAGQPAWDDHPLYIWDEWTAYINGTTVGLDQLDENKWTQGRRIASLGPLEFTVYSLAVAQATAELDPASWANDPQLKSLLAFNCERSMQVAQAAQATPELNHPRFDGYLEKFRTSPDASGLRRFARAELGADWCRQVFGF
ncbi:MAG: hypothetical protein KC910_35990 [Candidatus Eremiobacteraeota bacterium]|nr:hypothetical protein [Candidatus Eremiobacteraeota bacterium]